GHVGAGETQRLAEADEDLRVGTVASGDAAGLLFVDALRELLALVGERTVRVHRAHGAGKLAHLEEELHGEALHLRAVELPVGDREPEGMATEGPPRLDAREQIPDELLRSEHLAHDHGSSSQGRSSGAMPPPTGKNWRC